MYAKINNDLFMPDYLKLKTIQLNPERHFAANAFEHCEMVAGEVADLARLNICTAEETDALILLAKLHDIGKITGTANAEASLELLARYGQFDAEFSDLVKYHDINLPWFIAMQKGQPPSIKAWSKLARKVNLRMLCIFMTADRVDCPGGWQTNAALTWFLHECQSRGLLAEPLKFVPVPP